MKRYMISRKVSCALLLASLIIPLSADKIALANQDPQMTVGIVSKHFSSGYLPAAEEYVEYQIKLTNNGNVAIQNQSLWTLFESQGNHTHDVRSYIITSLNPGESKAFFLGPYKMREIGSHRLFLGVNTKGNPSLPNEVSLGFQPDNPVDSFFVYDTLFVQVLPTGIVLAISTVVIIVFITLYRRKRRN